MTTMKVSAIRLPREAAETEQNGHKQGWNLAGAAATPWGARPLGVCFRASLAAGRGGPERAWMRLNKQTMLQPRALGC